MTLNEEDEFEYLFHKRILKLSMHLSSIRCVQIDSYPSPVLSRTNQLDLENNLFKSPRLWVVESIFLPERDQAGDEMQSL